MLTNFNLQWRQPIKVFIQHYPKVKHLYWPVIIETVDIYLNSMQFYAIFFNNLIKNTSFSTLFHWVELFVIIGCKCCPFLGPNFDMPFKLQKKTTNTKWFMRVTEVTLMIWKQNHLFKQKYKNSPSFFTRIVIWSTWQTFAFFCFMQRNAGVKI